MRTLLSLIQSLTLLVSATLLVVVYLILQLLQPQAWQSQLITQLANQQQIEIQGLVRHGIGRWTLDRLSIGELELEQIRLDYRLSWRRQQPSLVEIRQLTIASLRFTNDEREPRPPSEFDWLVLAQPDYWQSLAVDITEQLQQVPSLPSPSLKLKGQVEIHDIQWNNIQGAGLATQLSWQPDSPGLDAQLLIWQEEQQLDLRLKAHQQRLSVATELLWQTEQLRLDLPPHLVTSELELQLNILPYEWQWQLQLEHQNWPDKLPQLDLFAHGQFDLSPFAEHQLSLELKHKDQQWLDLHAELGAIPLLRLQAKRLPLYPLSFWLPEFDGDLDTTAMLWLDDRLRMSFNLEGSGFWQDWPWRLEQSSQWDQGLTVDQLSLRLGDQRLQADAQLSKEQQLKANINIQQLTEQSLFWLNKQFLPAPLQQWLLQGQIALAGELTNPEWQTSLTAEIDPRGPWPIAANVQAKGDLTHSRIEDLTLISPDALKSELSGYLSWQEQQFDALGVIDLSNTELLKPWLSAYVDLDWLYAMALQLNSPRISAQGSFTDFILEADLNAKGTPAGESMHARFKGLSWQFPDFGWHLDDGELWSQENHIQAKGWFDLFAQTQLTGNVRLNDSQQIHRILNYYLDLDLPWPESVAWPNLEAELELREQLIHPVVEGQWQATTWIEEQEIQGSGHLLYQPLKLSSKGIHLSQLPGSIKAQGQLDFTQGTHDLVLELTDLDHQWLPPLLNELPLWQEELQQSSQQINGRISSEGTWLNPRVDIDLDSQLTWYQQPASVQLQVKGPWPYVEWPRVRIDFFDLGHAQSTGHYQANQDIDASWQARFNLEPILLLSQELGLVDWQGDLPFNGELHSQFELFGPANDRQIEGQQRLNMTLLNIGLTEPLPVHIRLDSNTNNSQWRSTLNLDLAERGQWQLQHRSPNNLEDLLELGHFHLQGESDLAAIYSLIGIDEQNFSGRVTGDLSLAGWRQPRLTGELQLVQGRYQNLRLGTKIDDLNLTMVAEGDRARIEQGRASDGAQGLIILTGNATWDEWQQLRSTVRLGLRDFSVVQRFDVEAMLQGDLDFNYSPTEASLNGNLQFGSLTIRLNQLAGINIPRLRFEMDDDQQQRTSWLDQVQLNLNLQANRRAFILGMGLEAELQGQIRIDGVVTAPNIQGEFNLIQGRYDLLTRVFRIEQGVIRLVQNEIFYNIRARHDRNDTQFFVNLEGEAERFDIELSSTPFMPEDELLAQLVFGRSLEGISTFQAVRLGLALNRLRTGGTDPLRATSDFFGIDTIDFDADEDDQISLMLGKYLTDQIFLEVGTGTGEQSGFSGRLRLDLNPQWRFEGYSTSGQRSSTGAELIWQRDF